MIHEHLLHTSPVTPSPALEWLIGPHLDLRPLHLDVLPVIRGEGDGQQGRSDDGRDGGERQGNRGARHGGAGGTDTGLALGLALSHTKHTGTARVSWLGSA